MKLKSLALMGSLLFLVACAEEEKKACSAVEVADFNAMQLVCNPPEIFTAQPAGPEGEKIKMSVLLLEKENKEKCAAAMDSYINKYGNYSCRAKKVQSGDVFTISSTKIKKKASKIEIEMATIEEEIKDLMTKKNKINKPKFLDIDSLEVRPGADQVYTELSKKNAFDPEYASAEDRYNALPGDSARYQLRRGSSRTMGKFPEVKESSEYICTKSGSLAPGSVDTYTCHKKINELRLFSESIFVWSTNILAKTKSNFDAFEFMDFGVDGVKGLKMYKREVRNLKCLKGVEPGEKAVFRCFSKIKYEDDKILDEKAEVIIDSEVQSKAQENEQEAGRILNDKNIEDPKVPVAPMGSAPESPIMQ